MFRKTIPYTLLWDRAPLDISFAFGDEKPAGKHGFLTIKGDKFTFEDGTPGRFWGTNFNGASCFPTHEYSEIVAKRLSAFGVNLVRLHQMDADWSTPNLFQFDKGKRLENTRKLDPRSIERLDYLLKCLRDEGIYIYMDLLTYRKFRSGDGLENAHELSDAAKPYANFSPKLIELQKEFNQQIWKHVNPYTGLAYKDDPAIVLTGITNENDLFSKPIELERYCDELENMFREWTEAKGIDAPKNKVDFKSLENGDVIQFLIELQANYHKDMMRHLRKIGVRIPITGSNWYAGGVALLKSLSDMDFTDGHTYWYNFGKWSSSADKSFINRSLFDDRGVFLGNLAFMKYPDKPYFTSEWDDPWPNEWRAESVLFLASASAFQGWGGAAIHTYRYDCREHIDMIGAPITSDCIGGISYRGGVFDAFNDPARFGLFYHAALMTRRQDVKEGKKNYGIEIDKYVNNENRIPRSFEALRQGLAELHRTTVLLPGEDAKVDAKISADDESLADLRVLQSDTGELKRDLDKRIGSIDTPRTKVVYGFLGNAGQQALDGLEVKTDNDFAVIALSSLTDAPLRKTDNILITTVGRTDNTNAKYNADHTFQIDIGHGPIRIEVIDAEVKLKTDQQGMEVWSYNNQGTPIGQIPTEHVDGELKFKLGGNFASMYYLVQKI